MAKISAEFFAFLSNVDDPERPKDWVLKAAAYLVVMPFYIGPRDAFNHTVSVVSGQRDHVQDGHDWATVRRS